MKRWYGLIMDSEKNPLRFLRPAQRFQVMLFLSIMWTSVFCSAAGLWVWYGALVSAHMLVLLAIFITAMTFQIAKSINGTTTAAIYRDHPRNDGSARYDDVWGG